MRLSLLAEYEGFLFDSVHSQQALLLGRSICALSFSLLVLNGLLGVFLGRY